MITPELILEAANPFLQDQGVTPDLGSMVVRQGAVNIPHLMLSDSTDELDIGILRNPHFEATILHKQQLQPGAEYRGLLRSMTAVVTLDVPSGELASRSEPGEDLLIQVSSSPDAINEAQIALGRTPGVNALKLVRMPERGHYDPGEWVGGIARHQHYVAGYADIGYMLHDISLSNKHEEGHPNSLIDSSTLGIARAVARAQAIEAEHGLSIYDSMQYRPVAVDDFADGFEHLALFTDPLRQGLLRLSGKEGLGVSIPPEEFTAADAQALAGYPDGGVNADRNLITLRQLGMISGKISEREARAGVRSIAAEFIAHIAGQLHTLEHIRTFPDELESRRMARVHLWEDVIAQHSAVPLADSVIQPA